MIPEEILSCKIRRILSKFFLSKKKLEKRQRELLERFFELISPYAQRNMVTLTTHSNYIIVKSPNDGEDVYAVFVPEFRGKQVVLVTDEDMDTYNIGRLINNFLADSGYHVYYHNQPMLLRNGMLGIGINSISKIQNIAHVNNKETKNEYVN